MTDVGEPQFAAGFSLLLLAVGLLNLGWLGWLLVAQ